MVAKSVYTLWINASIFSGPFIEKISALTTNLILPSLVIISAVALYTYLAGFGNRVQYSDAQEAKALLQTTNPEPITQILTSANNRTALARFKDGQWCLLHTMGHKWVTNTLSDNNLRAVKTVPKGLHVKFRKYTDPHVRIALDSDEQRTKWRAALKTQEV